MLFSFAGRFLTIGILSSSLRLYAHAQAPCPPMPALKHIFDTQPKCDCFYALAASGLELGNSTTFANAFDDATVQNYAQTGKYIGIDGITEYLSFAKGGTFVKDYERIGNSIPLDMQVPSRGSCVATFVERRHLPYNPEYTTGNVDLCVAVTSGQTLYYTMTGNQPPLATVKVQKINIWFPDELQKAGNSYILDTPATERFVCDVIVNACGDHLESSPADPCGNGFEKSDTKHQGLLKKFRGKHVKTLLACSDKCAGDPECNGFRWNPKRRHKKPCKTYGGTAGDRKCSKGVKKVCCARTQSLSMEECLTKYRALPQVDEIGGSTFIDGDTKGCRVLHSAFAATNPKHCPHVSFEAEEDAKGLVKCSTGGGMYPTNLFSNATIAKFLYYGQYVFGLGPTGLQTKVDGGCPASSV